jgi:hypothetical protein
VVVKHVDGDSVPDLVAGGSRVSVYRGGTITPTGDPVATPFDTLAGFSGGVFVG